MASKIVGLSLFSIIFSIPDPIEQIINVYTKPKKVA